MTFGALEFKPNSPIMSNLLHGIKTILIPHNPLLAVRQLLCPVRHCNVTLKYAFQQVSFDKGPSGLPEILVANFMKSVVDSQL